MHISFDLDGTICDSRDSIEKSLIGAFELNSLKVKKKIKIGPPLNKILDIHVGKDCLLKSKIQSDFIKIYDNQYAVKASIYPGIKKLLQKFKKKNYKLTIVTNKRKIPAIRILSKMKLINYFDIILTADDIQYGFNKSEKLKKIFFKNLKNFYIGDTFEDYVASSESNYKFILVEWGYEKFIHNYTIKTPNDLINLIND